MKMFCRYFVHKIHIICLFLMYVNGKQFKDIVEFMNNKARHDERRQQTADN